MSETAEQQSDSDDWCEEPPASPLAAICGYYLHCLGLDDANGVQLLQQTKSRLFVELPTFPSTESPITALPGVTSFLGTLSRPQQNVRQEPCVGYPLRISHQRGRDGSPQAYIEPVFIFEFDADSTRTGGSPQLSNESPVINTRILRSFAMGDEWHVMEDSLRLASELGISEGTPPPISELVSRIVVARSEWDWREEIDPAKLSSGIPLSDLPSPGIYNRAILFGADRSPFTRGLEDELAKLQKLSASHYRNTALGAWLKNDVASTKLVPHPKLPLLEPLPLNPEQREAVQKALTAPLTTITGPPGTGKSQVVSSILVNAARRGMKVLFVSKNNKAVDVVQERVNSLGPRPVMMRMGRGDFRTPIIERIGELLAGEVTPAQEEDFANAEKDYALLTKELGAINAKMRRIVELRNAVDTAERRVEFVRAIVSPEMFQRFGTLNPTDIRQAALLIKTASERTQRNSQGAIARFFWGFIAGQRQKALASAIASSARIFDTLGKPKPEPTADVAKGAAADLLDTADQVEAVSTYFAQLTQLAEGDKLEEVGKALTRLLPQVSPVALRLWKCWLNLAPKRLTPEDRSFLGQFASTLRLLVQAESGGAKIEPRAYARYYGMFAKVAKHLPCWAVTSLSAKGRLPFDAGIFDLLVVDEASQCDIASIVPLLYRSKAAVIIGDPNQLRHISGISPRRDLELLQQHGIDGSHSNWSFSENSIFDLASPLTRSEDIVTLKDHHRSHSAIIEFSNRHFYGGKLRVATNHDRLKQPVDNQAVRWLHVPGNVIRPTSGALNREEAQAVVAELERLVVSEGFAGSVGVATPFRAQANLIRQLLAQRTRGDAPLKDVLVDTVHRFQGDERDVILFSPVLSTGISEGAVRFLAKSGNLFNVAITRARASLIVVGDFAAALKCSVPYLRAFAEYVQELTAAKLPRAPFENGTSFPAVARPELVSDWERVFYTELAAAGITVIPQYDVEKYTLDFALLEGKRRLNIEVDGEMYHRAWDGELIHRDQMRNTRLQEMGWDVMRFWVPEIRDRMPQCIAKVKEWKNVGQ